MPLTIEHLFDTICKQRLLVQILVLLVVTHNVNQTHTINTQLLLLRIVSYRVNITL